MIYKSVTRAAAVIMIIVCLLAAGGCSSSYFDTDSLLRPPQGTGDEQSILEALEDTIGRQPLLRYPRKGDYRSAIVRADIDLDGSQEAIAFYRRSTDSVTTDVALVDKIDGKWQVVAHREGPGGDVERVLLGNFNKVGDAQSSLEVVVGWSASASSCIFSVYSIAGGVFSELECTEAFPLEESQSCTAYTELLVHDFDSDGTEELLSLHLNTASSTAIVRMFKHEITEESSSMNVIDSVYTDGNVTKYSQLKFAALTDSTNALVIDSYKDSNLMVTEIVMFDRVTGRLTTPLSARETGLAASTERGTLIDSRDIDQDGIIEFPQNDYLPGYPDAQGVSRYLTTWCLFEQPLEEGEDVLKPKLSSILNMTDGYCLMLTQQWLGHITVKYDTKSHIMYFHEVVSEEEPFGEELFRIQYVTWGSEGDIFTGTVLNSTESGVYVLYMPEQSGSSIEVTAEQVSLNFSIL